MKKIFVIDWLLLLAGILSTVTGIGMHHAGHFAVHEVWHNWAVAHILVSLFMLVTGVLHIQTHWNWYKGLLKGQIKSKSLLTILLSVVFVVLVATGLILLFIEGANSEMGIWHWVIGLLIIMLSAGHIIRRFHILKKNIKQNISLFYGKKSISQCK